MPSGGPLPSGPEPTVIDPVAGARERTLAFRFISTIGNDVVVEVQIGGPPCDTVTAADVMESPTQVLVTIWAGRTPAADCTGVPALLGTAWVRVPLSEPLGNRTHTAG